MPSSSSIDGKYTDCNTSAERLLEGTKEQIIGKTLWDLAPDVQPSGIVILGDCHGETEPCPLRENTSGLNGCSARLPGGNSMPR